LNLAGIRACALTQKDLDMNTKITPSIVTSALVPDTSRLAFLPRHFNRQMLIVEQEVFTQMRELCASYMGGYWNYFD
jgi:hypothetical protein